MKEDVLLYSSGFAAKVLQEHGETGLEQSVVLPASEPQEHGEELEPSVVFPAPELQEHGEAELEPSVVSPAPEPQEQDGTLPPRSSVAEQQGL
jgi:hypothetical protein